MWQIISTKILIVKFIKTRKIWKKSLLFILRFLDIISFTPLYMNCGQTTSNGKKSQRAMSDEYNECSNAIPYLDRTVSTYVIFLTHKWGPSWSKIILSNFEYIHLYIATRSGFWWRIVTRNFKLKLFFPANYRCPIQSKVELELACDSIYSKYRIP